MSDGPDQRRFARIEASISCCVATASDAFEAVVANLSKGGAAIIGPRGAAEVGSTMTLVLERAEGLVTASLAGRVARVEERGERAVYGVEFDALPPDEERQLVLLLQLVAGGRGQGRREHPRVAARIEVNCRTETSFRAWLNDLSKGGLSIRTPRDVPIGSHLVVSFGVLGIKGLVELAGEVVNSRPLERGFRIGVRFQPPTEDVRDQVAHSLEVLLGITLPETDGGG